MTCIKLLIIEYSGKLSNLFSEKHILNKKITLVENNDIVSNDADVAEIMKLYFSFAVQDLEIDGYAENLCSSIVNSDPISTILLNNLVRMLEESLGQ